MERNGGEVRLRTSPGEGTEVQLEMPRAKVST
jgi:signal transduction histidine kinase